MVNLSVYKISTGFITLFFIASCSASRAIPEYSVINNNNFYHLKYSLTNENIVSLDAMSMEQFIINGGQFETVLKKLEFPVNAPNCTSDLILRMPWTNPDIKNSDLFIQEKYQAYKNIKDIFDSKEYKSIDVYIELNPYIDVEENEITLTQCNIFFRQAKGRYITNTEALTQ